MAVGGPVAALLALAIALLALSAVRTGLSLTYAADLRAEPRAQPPPLPWERAAPPEANLAARAPLEAVARMDGSLEAALRAAVPTGVPGLVILTFGDSKVLIMVQNFVEHARSSGIPYIVGAIDALAFTRLSQRSATVYLTPLALEANYTMDGGNEHKSASWKRFAVMRTGQVARLVSMGYDVFHSDVDVIWLRNPVPYLRCGVADQASGAAAVGAASWEAAVGCATLRDADVAVSSDNMSPGMDAARGGGYAIGGTLNTGMLLIRATKAGKRFAAAWHEIVTSPPPGRKFAPPGCCTSDQQVFNRMVRDERLPYPGLIVPQGRRRVMSAWNGSVQLGVLPLGLFANGHHQFVQNASARLGLQPLAVHATYSLDRHDDLAKTQRFRENGLWRVDPPEYFSGKFLALRHSLSPEVAAEIDRFSKHGIVSSNIAVHLLALRENVRELRDALGLARALGRILVLPRWTCYCDRLWAGSDDIFHFGCMYPGAEDGAFLPFICPMDHVLSPSAWALASHPYRDATFLTDSRVEMESVEVKLVARASFRAQVPVEGNRTVTLPLPLNDDEARHLLEPFKEAQVITLPHSRSLLCGIASDGDRREMNRLAQLLLRTPEWCSTCFSKCSDELSKWLSPAEIASGADGPNRWCARFDPPPPLPSAHDGCHTVATHQVFRN